jgi:acyl carrier protein
MLTNIAIKSGNGQEGKKMFELVRDLIVDMLSIEKDDVQLDSNLFDDLGADSLDAVELNMALEEKTGISIPDDDLKEMKTVRDIVEYVEGHAA